MVFRPIPTAAEPGATVVAWTSVEDPVVSQRFFDAGAEVFVVKNDLATLQSVLRRFC